MPLLIQLVQEHLQITNTKLYIPVATLSTLNVKLLPQSKPGFKRTINWNKYQSKVTLQVQNSYLDYLVDPIFLGVHRLSFCHLEIKHSEKDTQDIFFQSRSKSLQYHD